MKLAEVTTRLRHRVRVVHASTGMPIAGVVARLDPVPYGWSLRTLPDGTTVVSARDDVIAPAAPPDLVITVVDGRAADLLVIPPLLDRPPNTILVGLTGAELEVSLHPVPMTLTVVLTTPSTGAPRRGRTVVARARSGPNPRPTIALPEVAPGTYTSAAVEWTSAFLPADLLVGGDLLRVLTIDLSTKATRIHLVDTT